MNGVTDHGTGTIVQRIMMQRIMIMGACGSGKSTLARQLGARLGLPVFHLDQAFFGPGWVDVPDAAFHAEVERLAGLPAWVIDGNYTDTIAPRLRAADTLIYLDPPRWRAISRVIRRLLASYGRVRADSAPGCPEWFDLEFLHYAWSWNARHRARSLTLVERFPGRTIILRNNTDHAALFG